ncbi:MAG: orotate phosphoribosyltransferase [Desulfobacteraceae bacterium]|nr:orotate phosphoribosyltransferase [Desulfobacteraceae bacterium]
MLLENYKQQFIEFMVHCGVLTFGDFVTKSGRKTPYFINTGNYRTGSQMEKLGGFYAEAIRSHFADGFDVLFGPAYKGIPLCVCTSTALYRKFGQDVSFCFNRKEAKDHGEGGSLVGAKLADGQRVLIVEDVTTAGTSIRETVPILRGAANVHLAGLIVSVDRMEKGASGVAALTEVGREFDMPAKAIVTIDEVVGYLYGREINGVVVVDELMKKRIDAYRAEYGA